MPAVSIVIPTLNEECNIARTLDSIRSGACQPVEIIVVDGGSNDCTRALAKRGGATVLLVTGGRAAQLNAGGHRATGERILFMHADTRVPPCFDHDMQGVLAQPRVIAGAFRLAIEGDLWGIRTVERFANLRARILKLPYGDQGLFLNKTQFVAVGGYPDMPFMEDYVMTRRLARRGALRIAPSAVTTSARRWEMLGVVRTTMMNQIVICAYHLGFPVPRLRAWYRGVLVRAARRRALT